MIEFWLMAAALFHAQEGNFTVFILCFIAAMMANGIFKYLGEEK